MEDPLSDSFTPGVGPLVTPHKAPSCQVKFPPPQKQHLLSPIPSLTCNWCLQVVAKALAKAEELNGPELAAKLRSQPRDPLAARLQVITHVGLPIVIQKLVS